MVARRGRPARRRARMRMRTVRPPPWRRRTHHCPGPRVQGQRGGWRRSARTGSRAGPRSTRLSTTRRTPVRRAASSTFRVPVTFVLNAWYGSWNSAATSTLLAECTTAAGATRLNRSTSASRSSTLPVSVVKRESRSTYAISGELVTPRVIAVTSRPSSASARTMYPPMKPRPPVTRMRSWRLNRRPPSIPRVRSPHR